MNPILRENGLTAFVDPSQPYFAASPLGVLNHYRKHASTDGVCYGRWTVEMATVRFFRREGSYTFEITTMPALESDFVRVQWMHDMLMNPVGVFGGDLATDLRLRAGKYVQKLRSLDSSANPWFVQHAKELVFQDVYSSHYEPVLKGCKKCHGDLQEKRTNGVITLTCTKCGLVDSSDVFSGADQSERVFEEEKEKQNSASRYHRARNGNKRSFIEMENLLATHHNDYEEQKTKKLTKGKSRLGLLKSAAYAMAAILDSRAVKDSSLCVHGFSAAALPPGKVAKRKELLRRCALGDDDSDTFKALAAGAATMRVVSRQSADILLSALSQFDSCFLEELSLKYKGVKHLAKKASFCLIRSLRIYDTKHFGKTCPRHTIEDFCSDGAYYYCIRKSHSVRVKPYFPFMKEYEEWEKEVYALAGSTGETRLLHIEQAILRVLNELRLTDFTLPVKTIPTAPVALMYVYRSQARARVLCYWSQVSKQCQKDAKLRSLLYSRRENILIACGVVFSALRSSEGAVHIRHAWPYALLSPMEDLWSEEQEFRKILPTADVPKQDFFETRTAYYNLWIVPNAVNPLDRSSTELAARNLEALEIYKSYRTARLKLGSLTDQDILFRFEVRWLSQLFNVAHKRIESFRGMLPAMSAESAAAAREASSVGVLVARAKELEESKTLATTHSAVVSESGVTDAMAIQSKYSRRRGGSSSVEARVVSATEIEMLGTSCWCPADKMRH